MPHRAGNEHKVFGCLVRSVAYPARNEWIVNEAFTPDRFFQRSKRSWAWRGVNGQSAIRPGKSGNDASAGTCTFRYLSNILERRFGT
jgi:hypothetical protein